MSKKIKIFKAFHAYQNYLDAFYDKNKSLKKASFREQRKALINDGSPWIFSWSTNNNNENIEIFETVHNCEYLQKAWTSNFKNHEDWQIQIVYEQIKTFQPNICVLYPPMLFSQEKIEKIRSLVKHEIIFGGYDGMNRQNIDLYSDFDFIITCSDYISKYYIAHGRPTYTLLFGFDEKILPKISQNINFKYDVAFTGSIYPNIHDGRYELLKELSKKVNLSIRSDFLVNVDYRLLSIKRLKKLIKYKDFSNYLGLWRIGKNNLGPVYGLDMYQFLRDSKISINMHGDKINFAANVRMYEITGVGSCLLTDWKENIGDLFEPEKEIVTYSYVKEAIDKSKFFLRNENARKKIATAGQTRTLKEYTLEKRISKLMNFLTELRS